MDNTSQHDSKPDVEKLFSDLQHGVQHFFIQEPLPAENEDIKPDVTTINWSSEKEVYYAGNQTNHSGVTDNPDQETNFSSFNALISAEDEKPCILALRAALETYEKDMLSDFGPPSSQFTNSKDEENSFDHEAGKSEYHQQVKNKLEEHQDVACSREFDTDRKVVERTSEELTDHFAAPHHAACRMLEQECFNKGLHPCLMCSVEFSQLDELEGHMRHTHSELYTNSYPEAGSIQRSREPDVEVILSTESCSTNKYCLDFSRSQHGQSQSKTLKQIPRLVRGKKDEERRYKCDLCNKVVKHKSTLLSHILVHSEGAAYKCDLCDRGFTRNGQLIKHKKIHSAATLYRCDLCNQVMKKQVNLQNHMSVHTGEFPHKCDLCDKGFKHINKLRWHEETQKCQTLEVYKCDECGKEFNNNYKLRRHKKIHDGKNLFKCDLCGKGFQSRFQLRRHEKVHRSGAPFQCDVCGKRFKWNSALRRHKMIHNGESPHLCDICGKSFRESAKLKRHKLVHAPGREKKKWTFRCKVCNECFGDRFTLSCHTLLHAVKDGGGLESDKCWMKYKCDLCGKRFLKNPTLERHKMLHNFQTPYTCDVCGSRFAQQFSLDRHMNIHRVEPAYRCNVCCRGFNQKEALGRHMRLHKNS